MGSDPAARRLSSRRVVVTRPREQAAELVVELERLGVLVTAVPLVEIRPPDDERALDEALAARPYDWVVLTSANGVHAVGSGLRSAAAGARFAAVGSATADALREVGIEPAFVPGRYAADALADGLGEVEGARVLLAQADIADPVLGDELRQRGAEVVSVVAYRTVAIELTEHEVDELRRSDAILLASGSAARSLADAVPSLEGPLVVCIGPKTAAVAREAGLEVGLVAEEATAEGMIQALVTHFGENR